jgi:tRNA C32,U32 (ribose-2'-O)-methylase TrmJ
MAQAKRHVAAPVRVVLIRPRNPENLGAVARAMKNFGLADWAIAELGTHDFATARRVAVHAEDLLDRPRLVRTLDEAVADCAWVVGTSSRRVEESGASRRRRSRARCSSGRRRGGRPSSSATSAAGSRTTRSTAATTSPSSRRTKRSRR